MPLPDYMNIVSFDFETTGIDPWADRHRIVELGAIKFDRDGNEIGWMQSLVNPEMFIPTRVTEIHGITDAMVADAPTAGPVIGRFLEFIGRNSENILIGHNIQFDLGFFEAECANVGLPLPTPRHSTLCTFRTTQKLKRGLRSYKLENLAILLNLSSGNNHRALEDCIRSKELFMKLNMIEHVII